MITNNAINNSMDRLDIPIWSSMLIMVLAVDQRWTAQDRNSSEPLWMILSLKKDV